MSNDLMQYKDLYIKTAKDLINEIKTEVDLLKANPTDGKTIEKLHRNFHSLKSQSLVMGFNSLGIVNKHLEAIFLTIKEKKLELNKELIDTIHKIVINMERSIITIETDTTEIDLSADIAALELLVEFE
jgi:chemotaxis protein histidine kinase CheA